MARTQSKTGRQADRQTGRHTDNGGYWLTHMGHTRSYSDARNDK